MTTEKNKVSKSRNIPSKLAKLIEYIVENSECESALLQPRPQHYVFSEGLLDEIVEIFEVDVEELSAFVDEITDNIEQQRNTKEIDNGT